MNSGQPVLCEKVVNHGTRVVVTTAVTIYSTGLLRKMEAFLRCPATWQVSLEGQASRKKGQIRAEEQ